jgi:hypothetical protein
MRGPSAAREAQTERKAMATAFAADLAKRFVRQADTSRLMLPLHGIFILDRVHLIKIMLLGRNRAHGTEILS